MVCEISIYGKADTKHSRLTTAAFNNDEKKIRMNTLRIPHMSSHSTK